MKKHSFLILILISISFFFSQNSYSQLGNKNMYLLANVNTHQTPYSAVWGYKAPDGREYAIIGSYDGTQFVDVTDVTNIIEVGFVPSTNPGSSSNLWREMKTYSHYAYIVSEVTNSGIQIVDLQYLPDSVHYVKKFLPSGFSKSHTISQEGPYLYVNGASVGQGVTVYDLTSDPETPVKRGAYNSLYIHDCRVFNDTIYAANVYEGKISIISASNKNSLTQVIQPFNNLVSSGPHNTAVTYDRKNLLVTDEIGAFPRLLKIWNIEDLYNIYHVASWQPTGITNTIIHNVESYGDYALIAHYEAGVRLVDISNRSLPTEVAWYDTYPSDNPDYNGCWGVYMFPTGKIIASDRSTGLYVLKTNFNIKLAIEGFYDNVLNKHIINDTVTAYLREVNSPYNIIDSSRKVIDQTTLTGNFEFNSALTGTYYISIRHRNSIETWSKVNGESYNPMTMMSYDFTTSNTKAFGNNMIQVDASPVITALYSGDVTQDGVIDASDMSVVENDKSNSVTGYVSSDVNGDFAVDASDVSIVENNSSSSVMVSKP
ncbi:MAG: choice-of-anchor B family protein [Ignavibacteria bacterium]|nr:choice-of-anchor B family protein [Ignavibacteria bacterium]